MRKSSAAPFGLALGLALAACSDGPGSSCRSDVECASELVCLSGLCTAPKSTVCAKTADCVSGEICVSGTCRPECEESGCAAGLTCDTASHQCVALASPSADAGSGLGPAVSPSSGSSGGTSSTFCAACAADNTCGSGNTCQVDLAGDNVCASDCSKGQACPVNAQCETTTDQNQNTVMQCIPASCPAAPTTSAGSTAGGSGSSTTSGGGTGTSSTTTTTTGGGQCADSWTNFASSFFTTYCSQCHSWPSSYSSTVSEATSIQSELSSNSMPPSYETQPSQADINRILAWINCGTPE